MEFKCNQVVVLRNGKVGVVACFNEKPFQVVFDSYTNPTKKYDEELKHNNPSYDVMEIFDGSSIENVADVFKRSFKTDGLTSVWKREE